MATFNVNMDNGDDLVHCIRIDGELRRGTQLDTDLTWKKHIYNAVTASKTKVVLFDLQNLKYWDTRGITEIIGTVISINENSPKRSGIIAPKDPHLFRLAKDKHAEVGENLVPWKKSKEELLDFLQS